MSLISTTIPNLVNGVSQQPYALRLASQADEQINGLSSVSEGLLKRPPTRHSARIKNTPVTKAFLHTINRDTSERYVVIIDGGLLQVYDLQGNQKTVNFPNGTAYLSSLNSNKDFTAVTVADYTFIANKTKAVAKGATKTPTRPYEALIWVKSGAYSSTYNVTVGSVTATYATAASDAPGAGATITTDNIASQLATQLTSGLPAAYTVQRQGSTIRVKHDTVKFDVRLSDGQGDTNLKLIYGTVQNFTDLPAKSFGGMKIRVRGSSANPFDDYWVTYDTSESTEYGGVWKESAAPNEETAFDPSTMPHVLVREADGTFTFKQAAWDDRKVGDLESVPYPSFVGRTINDIFFHRNRLGFLSDENVIMSRAGEFFNFFKASAIQTVDSDPIDVAVSHIKVSLLKHAVPFNESLLLFADQTQFMLGKSELLTPKTISINQTTEFEANLQAKPVGAGQNIYFAQTRGSFSGIREYYVDGETETNDAADITAHCPKYIKGSVIKLAASTNEDMLAVLSSGDQQSLYVYRYYWSGSEKMMSSWSRWVLPQGSTILNMDFIESDLWIVISRPDGVYIEVISLEPGRVDYPTDFTVHLDRRLDLSKVASCVYDAEADATVIVLPFNTHPGENWQLIAWNGDGTQTYKPGEVVTFTSNGTDTFVAAGKVTSFFLGVSYEFRYRFSTLVLREAAQGGGGLQPIGEGRIQVRGMTMTYSNTGYFRAEVTPSFRDTYKYVFSGRVLGSARNKVNQVPIEEGLFKFPVAAKNDQVTIDLVNDTYLPCTFMGAEWEAFFVLRSKRI